MACLPVRNFNDNSFALPALPTEAVELILSKLFSADAYSLCRVSKDFKSCLKEVLDLQGVCGMHYWGLQERSSRKVGSIPLAKLPAFQSAFTSPPAEQQQSQTPPSNNDQQGKEPAGVQAASVLQQQETQRKKPLLLTTAALMSTRLGCSSNSSGIAASVWKSVGNGRQMGLELIQRFFGAPAADVVRAITGCEACPDVARGFFSCLLFGLLTSATALQTGAAQHPPAAAEAEAEASQGAIREAASKHAWVLRQFVAELIDIATPNSTSKAVLLSSADAAVVAAAADPVWCQQLRVLVREFLGQLSVWLRAAPLASNIVKAQLLEWAALQSLQDMICQELRWAEAYDQAAAEALGFGFLNAVPYGADNGNCGLPNRRELNAYQRRVVDHAIPKPAFAGQPIPETVSLIQALAGSGKTTTVLKMMCDNMSRNDLCIVYNRSVQEATAGFLHGLNDYRKKHKECRTAHSLARDVLQVMKGRGWRVGSFTTYSMTEALKATPYFVSKKAATGKSAGAQHGADVIDILEQFVTSTGDRITLDHVQKARAKQRQREFRVKKMELNDYVIIAQQMWDKIVPGHISMPRGRVFYVSHNVYLKIFVIDVVAKGTQLKHPLLQVAWDAIIVDEAQDMNPLMLQLVMSQRCAKVFVGDEHQRIYSFNNSTDALAAAEHMATEAGIPVQHFSLPVSFRLGQPVARVADRLLYMLGLKNQAIVAGRTKPSAVYGLIPDTDAHAQQQQQQNQDQEQGQGPNAAVAAAAWPDVIDLAAEEDAAEAAAAAAVAAVQTDVPFICKRLEHLQHMADSDPLLPETWETLTLPTCSDARDQLKYLVKAPIHPFTGEQLQVMVLCRYNATAFGILASLAMAALNRQDNRPPAAPAAAAGLAGGINSRRSSLAGTDADSRQLAAAAEAAATAAAAAAEAAATEAGLAAANDMPAVYLSAADGDDAPFLGRLKELCVLIRYGDWRVSHHTKPKYVFYDTLDKLKQAVEEELLSPELFSALDIIEKWGLDNTWQTVIAAERALVKNRASAVYIISTCHKAKGDQADFVQIADDFITVVDGISLKVDVDEYNCVYIAVSRAKRGLVLNQDLLQLMQGLMPSLQNLLQFVCGPAAQQVDSEHNSQEQQMQHCGSCGQLANAVAFSGDDGSIAKVINLQLRYKLRGALDNQPLCCECIKKCTIWGELFASGAGDAAAAAAESMAACMAAAALEARKKRADAAAAAADAAVAAENEEWYQLMTELDCC